MSRAYYGSKISDNIIKLNDGCILCKNVPIARTGDYQCLACEMGMDGNEIVTVSRNPEDVFDPKVLASFEGKAFTDDHPPVEVSIDNWSMYSKGEIKDVRRGTGIDSDKLIADILVRDPITVSKIQSGKREISAGYECEYVQNDSGHFYQKSIIGNHVALVDEGRAGHSVCIRDKQVKENKKVNRYKYIKTLQNAIKKMEV